MKLAKTYHKILIIVLAIAVLGISSALYMSHKMKAKKSPVVETAIFQAAGVEFEPGKGKYSIVVWSRVKLSTDYDREDLFQTRIEVTGKLQTFGFEWPRAYSCEPNSVELRDLAGNGKKAFVLWYDMDLRVVQFTDKAFRFRPNMDRLDSVGSQSRFVDFGNDGRLEYIASLNYPQRFGDPQNYRTLPFPVIYRWSPERGFEEVSEEFPEFYRGDAIPELRKLKDEAEDPLRKPLFDSAIGYIEQRISSATAQKMLPQD
jgi:hypothetical protein